MKVVINESTGGFNLSDIAIDKLEKIKNISRLDMCIYDMDRADKDMISVVEELGKDATYPFNSLRIVEIPDGSYYVICDCDGCETLHYSESTIYEVV